jgi:hypothetical protein
MDNYCHSLDRINCCTCEMVGPRFRALQGKRDENEPEIIAAYKAVGATAEINPLGQGRPDLDVGFRDVNYKVEVKMPGAKLTADQVIWHRDWKGQKAIVTTVKEALAVIGIRDF